MADVEVLADPAAMSTEERTDELLRLISLDDLLGVLLVLYCVQGDEIDGISRFHRVPHDPPRQTLPGFIELLQEWRNDGA
ncbi:hypothetical protein JCM10296v2_001980 [Rhodotorula toruloides]